MVSFDGPWHPLYLKCGVIFFLEPEKNGFKKYFCRCVDKAFVLWNSPE